MQRVTIVGCPGSGKTTFARELGEKTNLPVVHLDYYYHQLKHNYYEDKEAWVTKVKNLVEQDKWIMDGNYNSTIPMRFKSADTIIFFDFPRWLSFYRVLKRRVQYRNKQREEMPSEWKEKADLDFLKYVWSFNKFSKVKILAALNENKGKDIVVFKNPKQVKYYLTHLGFGGPSET